ncbi:MAG: HK97 gp10 family phage protein [Candidatus Caldarchaeum sp.]
MTEKTLDFSVTLNVNKDALSERGMSLVWLVRELADMILEDAKRRTPVRTGALRNSGHIRSLDEDRFLIAFGGPAAPYAYYVHENLKARHRVGEAKYLEKAMANAQRYLQELLA